MKHPLKHLTESLARPIHGRGGPATRWASVAVLLGASTLACSDEGSSANPSVAMTPVGAGNPVVPAGGTGGNEAAAGSSGTATEGVPSAAEMTPLPELITGGAGGGAAEAAAAIDGGITAGGVGGAGGAPGMGGSGGAPEDEWVPLFNGANLDGWVVHGSPAMFAVENGEIHVYPTQADQSNQPAANLRNLTLLGGKYTLHVEYRWGDARFIPRAQVERDAGILFHIAGNITQVWPDSIECQIGSSPVNADWVTGDLWVIGTPTTAQTLNDNNQLQTFGGGFGYSPASAQAENPYGEWNVVDVIIDGAVQAIYMVNGVEVNRVFNMTYGGQPLSEGFISVQAEHAELYYRNIQYKLDE
jgi:hypothetical protein